MNSSSDIQKNLVYIEEQSAIAKEQGVEVLQLPENFAQMAMNPQQQKVEVFQSSKAGESEIQQFISATAKRYELNIIAGSVPIRDGCSELDTRAYARTLVYDASGQLIAHYDKIHLFDVELASGQKYRESSTYRPGTVKPDNIVKVPLACGNFGLSICYDLRFPELYRRLSELQANVLCVPSAFTFDTGKAHWQTLLQSRAIENSAFVFAAAQTGTHDNGRVTWGHSMIVDPWGTVIASLEGEAGLLVAEIDIAQVRALQESFPVHMHRRL